MSCCVDHSQSTGRRSGREGGYTLRSTLFFWCGFNAITPEGLPAAGVRIVVIEEVVWELEVGCRRVPGLSGIPHLPFLMSRPPPASRALLLNSLPLLTARLLHLSFCLCPLPVSLVPAFVLVLSPPIRRRRWPSDAATRAGNQPRGRPRSFVVVVAHHAANPGRSNSVHRPTNAEYRRRSIANRTVGPSLMRALTPRPRDPFGAEVGWEAATQLKL